jgi:arginine decarboxylase
VLRHVVEEVLACGRQYGFGLEAGSKPELLAVLALTQNGGSDDRTPIIRNGFKDDEFIKMVVLARKRGKNIIPVVEKFSEPELVANSPFEKVEKASDGGAITVGNKVR